MKTGDFFLIYINVKGVAGDYIPRNALYIGFSLALQ